MARLKAVKAARGAERREEIVRSASAVLRQRKSGPFRMERVAQQLGLVKGNIYYYFNDRQDLMYHCHARAVEESLRALQEVKTMEGAPSQRLRWLLLRHIEIIVGSKYGGAVLADLDELKPAQRRRNVAMRDRFEAGVRRLIQEGVTRREFRQVNPALAGFAILGSINWMPKWFREDGPMSSHEVAEWFADFHVRGLKR